MRNVARFAGYAYPAQLAGDPLLTREQKISGLETWREAAVRGVPGRTADWVIAEIDRVLRELRAT